MKARFYGGPLDGTVIEFAKAIDKLLIVDDDGGIVRYECDIEDALPDYAAGETAPDCYLRSSQMPVEFDEEVMDVLQPGGRAR